MGPDAAGDDRAGHRSHSRRRGDEPLGVGMLVEVGDAFLEVLDLLGQEPCLVGLCGDVCGQLGEVHPHAAVGLGPECEGLAGAAISAWAWPSRQNPRDNGSGTGSAERAPA